MSRAKFIAEVVTHEGRLSAHDFFARTEPAAAVPIARGRSAAEGDFVAVEVRDGVAHPHGGVLASARSAAAEIFQVAVEFELDPTFPSDVEREVSQIVAAPGIDDPSLTDMCDLPFVTIDNPDSRDLDQAMFLAREGEGYRVAYAIADAAHYVRPGSALFAEAARRGATYYLPGWAVPMLPRALSEDLVSLNPHVDRRALVFDMHLDAAGEVVRTQLVRARIHSHAKLAYPDVQDYYDSPQEHALRGEPYTETLDLLREVGTRRMRLAAERDVVRYRRREVQVRAGAQGARFTIWAADRNDCERFNEQISLLCNTEGARLFADAGTLPNLQPVFRVHEPPHHRRVAEFARTVEALSARAGLDPDLWHWQREREESLAEYLDRLPREGPDAGRARAIQRQALVINNRSEFDDEPAPHHGVGADAYARFSSPMREVVGVFTHKEAIELLEGRSHETVGPEESRLQAQMIKAGNRAKDLQSRVTKAVNKLAIDAVLSPDLELELSKRPRRRGVLLGLAPTKAYVALTSPPVEVKIYFETLRERDTHCEADASLLGLRCGELEVVVGETLELVVIGLDDGRWALAPALAHGDAG